MKRRIAKKIWLAGCIGKIGRHRRNMAAWFNAVGQSDRDMARHGYADPPKWAPSEQSIVRGLAREGRRIHREQDQRSRSWRQVFGMHEGSRVWTDYPFTELGDAPGATAPWREVILVSYDGNKYATVRLPDGKETWVKLGYLQKDRPEEAEKP